MIGPFPVINKLRLILSGFCSQSSLTPFSLGATSFPASENVLVLLELGSDHDFVTRSRIGWISRFDFVNFLRCFAQLVWTPRHRIEWKCEGWPSVASGPWTWFFAEIHWCFDLDLPSKSKRPHIHCRFLKMLDLAKFESVYKLNLLNTHSVGVKYHMHTELMLVLGRFMTIWAFFPQINRHNRKYLVAHSDGRAYSRVYICFLMIH